MEISYELFFITEDRNKVENIWRGTEVGFVIIYIDYHLDLEYQVPKRTRRYLLTIGALVEDYNDEELVPGNGQVPADLSMHDHINRE
jgi:hypothetical protein